MNEVDFCNVSLDIQQIMKLLPHTYPFLLLDQAMKVEPGEYGEGIKNVSINEPYFQGHFPGNPIMPGVLIIEALAQLTAIINGTKYCLKKSGKLFLVEENASDKVGYLAQVSHMKFYQLVRPGDQLILKAEKTISYLNVSSFNVRAIVKEKLVAKGSITVTCNDSCT